MTLDWTTPARRDLDRIWHFNVARGEEKAIAIEDRLIAAAAALLTNPQIGRPGAVPGTRERIVRESQYLLVYEILDDGIRILRVWSTAEDRR